MYPGIHNVRYIASDAAGNRAECHFSIHVRGKFMPLYARERPKRFRGGKPIDVVQRDTVNFLQCVKYDRARSPRKYNIFILYTKS